MRRRRSRRWPGSNARMSHVLDAFWYCVGHIGECIENNDECDLMRVCLCSVQLKGRLGGYVADALAHG